MKTFVVRLPGDATRSWIGNAESVTEAVAYARARGDLFADRYIVFDWDANAFEVTITPKAEVNE